MKDNYNYLLKAFAFCCLFFIFSFQVSAQVGIGTTDPNPNALLDVDASTTPGGLLLPRVSLDNTNSFAPLTANVAGMVVYNIATAGIAPNNVTPGYYYNDGFKWVRIAADLPSDDWSRTGNAGTIEGIGVGQNYLGTTDGQGLIIATQATQRMRLLANGQVIINNTGAPVVGDRLTVQGANNEYAINGYTSGASTSSVYGENITNGGIGIWGTAPAGNGVYGTNSTGAGNGVFGNSTYVGVRGYGAYGAHMESGHDLGYGVIAWNITASGTNRTGLIAAGQNLDLLSFPTTGAILYGTGSGAVGFADNNSGTGLIGVGNRGTTAYTLTAGSGIAGIGSSTGVYGISTATSGTRQGAYFTMNKTGAVSPPATDDPVAILAGYNGTSYFGGYFDGNQDNIDGGNGFDYAYVGIRSGGTTYKVLGTGSNSTMVNDSSGNKRVLFSPEAPEILFEDYGTGQLVNGVATVTLDPLLSSIIHVSERHPLKVFIQLEGECNGVFVMAKSKQGFMVKELANGRSNVAFSWHIVANREDTKLADGTVFSKHVDVRFPIGPNKIKPIQTIENSAVSNTDYSSKEIKIMGKTKKYAYDSNQTGTVTNNPQAKTSTSEASTERNN